jgi:hypothetical protein
MPHVPVGLAALDAKMRGVGMLVHIVAGYGRGDLAFAEVVQRIRIHLPDAEPVLTPVPPFATLAAGSCIAQLGLNEAPPGTLIYHNVARRADDREARAGKGRLHRMTIPFNGTWGLRSGPTRERPSPGPNAGVRASWHGPRRWWRGRAREVGK